MAEPLKINLFAETRPQIGICEEVLSHFKNEEFNFVSRSGKLPNVSNGILVHERNCFDQDDFKDENVPLPIEFQVGIRMAAAAKLPLMIQGRSDTLCWEESVDEIVAAVQSNSEHKLAQKLKEQFVSHSYDCA